MGADPAETATRRGARAPAHRPPADREADAERQRSRPRSPRAAEEAGADAVSLINTLKGMALDPRTRQPWLGGTTGGVSGPAVRAIALEQVRVGRARRSESR